MANEREHRCGRCGGDAFGAGDPYTFWIWLPDGAALKERALRICRPCGREFGTPQARLEYLRLTSFG